MSIFAFYSTIWYPTDDTFVLSKIATDDTKFSSWFCWIWGFYSKNYLRECNFFITSEKPLNEGKSRAFVFFNRTCEKMIFGELFHSVPNSLFIRLSNSKPDKKGKFGTWDDKCTENQFFANPVKKANSMASIPWLALFHRLFRIK